MFGRVGDWAVETMVVQQQAIVAVTVNKQVRLMSFGGKEIFKIDTDTLTLRARHSTAKSQRRCDGDL